MSNFVDIFYSVGPQDKFIFFFYFGVSIWENKKFYGCLFNKGKTSFLEWKIRK